MVYPLHYDVLCSAVLCSLISDAFYVVGICYGLHNTDSEACNV